MSLTLPRFGGVFLCHDYGQLQLATKTHECCAQIDTMAVLPRAISLSAFQKGALCAFIETRIFIWGFAMNKLLLAASAAVLMSSTAFAADFGIVNQPEPAGYIAPATDWNGFYVGVFGGLTNGPFDYSLVPVGLPSALDVNVNGGGALAGVQIGGDVQFDQFVLGAVADIAFTNHRAEAGLTVPGVVGGGLNAESRLTYLGTVRARAGYAFDDVLAYVHGGLAYGRTEASITAGGVAVPGINAADRVGYAIGAGVEYKVSDSISLQTEYSYTGFGEQSIYDVGPGFANVNEALGFHTVKAGLNFRF